MRTLLKKAVLAGELREIDLHAALFLYRLAAKPSDELLLGAALASRAVGEGHICLPLTLAARKEVFDSVACRGPELASWRQALRASGVVGQNGRHFPLVLDEGDRLYLGRFYEYERIIAEGLLARSREQMDPERELAAGLVGRLFPSADDRDRQKMAAAAAVLRKFLVISGGPGTGKTYTVARLLVLLQNLAGGGLKVGLAAPTGRAAVRLQESLSEALQVIDRELAAGIAAETKTLHRLLGFRPDRQEFRYDSSNRLHFDLLIVDEASMIDVPLMAALVSALPEKARLILVGDRDQLTSVEAGSLLGDICAGGEQVWSTGYCQQVARLAGWAPEPSGLQESFGDTIVLLDRSYRFHGGRGIAGLARLVQTGNVPGFRLLYEEEYEDLELKESGQDNPEQLLAERLPAGYGPAFTAGDPGEALDALGRFRILCAVREGDYGVAGINRLAEKILHRHGYISSGEQWYPGRPLIIRQNHYGLQLFNGDTGIVWPDADGRLWAWFRRADASLHQVPLSRLPVHDSAYAITVHQSQGSEFARVLFMLPPADNRILSRELLYTGITRAREKLSLFGSQDIIATAMTRNVLRYSGLRERLWAETAPGIHRAVPQ